MNIKEYGKLKGMVMDMEKDVTKFEQGNNAAGGRIRKALQEIKTDALAWRKAYKKYETKEQVSKLFTYFGFFGKTHKNFIKGYRCSLFLFTFSSHNVCVCLGNTMYF